MKQRIKEVERSEEILVIATDGSHRKVRRKKRTWAGVVIKKGERTMGPWEKVKHI